VEKITGRIKGKNKWENKCIVAKIAWIYASKKNPTSFIAFQ